MLVVGLLLLPALCCALGAALVVEASRRRAVERRVAELAAQVRDSLNVPVGPVPEAPGPQSPRIVLDVRGTASEHPSVGDAAVHTQSELVDRLRSALDAISEAVIICDDRGTVVYRNSAATDLSHHSAADVVAEDAIVQALAATLDGERTTCHIECYGPPRRVLALTAMPLVAGVPGGGVVVVDDVSEQRRVESMRRDFISNISHELRTPVGALAVLAEAISEETSPAVIRRLSGRLEVEAQRLTRMIDDLLSLSSIESEEAPLKEAVSIEEVVKEAVARIQPATEQRSLTIDVGPIPPDAVVLGDRRQLISAVYNLLDNAVKYSDKGEPVRVEVRRPRPEGNVEIAVIDRGIGIPQRDRERIFERFYRVDRARARDTGGTGLGLAIVRHVAGNHRGEIAVESLEGQGSTFTLSLPGTARLGLVQSRAS